MPPKGDHRSQPGPIGLLQRGFRTRQTEQRPALVDDGKADPRAQIEDARQQPGIDRADEQFGQRGCDAEQHGGSEREWHTWPQMGRFGHAIRLVEVRGTAIRLLNGTVNGFAGCLVRAPARCLR